MSGCFRLACLRSSKKPINMFYALRENRGHFSRRNGEISEGGLLLAHVNLPGPKLKIVRFRLDS